MSRLNIPLRRPLTVLVVMLLALGVLALPAQAADNTAAMSIQKSASASTVEPGQTFEYTIQVQCTAGTVDGCINAVVTDTLPDGLTIAGNPSVTGSGKWAVDSNDTSMTVTFQDALGAGAIGLAAGDVITITVPVQLDPDYPQSLSGQDLTNTATITADNAATKSATATVTPEVPTTLDAETTKSIDPAGAPAAPGTPLTVALTGKNTSNAPVDTLVISDPVAPNASPSPFDYLALSSIDSVTLPEGAETVQVRVYVNGAWVDGPVGPPAALPAGVDPADVTGVQFVFTSTTDPGIQPGATAGVDMTWEQRDNVADLTDPITIKNDAVTTVTADGDSATSDPASDTYRIPPSAVDVHASKSFDPDTVTAGDPSTVTLGGRNDSEVPLDSMTITEPASGSGAPFGANGLTFTGWSDDPAIAWPNGADSATVTYQCDGAPIAPATTTVQNTLPDPPAGCDVTGFTIEFEGTIVPGAQATIPFTVDTPADQATDELTRLNRVRVDGDANGVTGTDDAADTIKTIVPRLAVDVGKKIKPGSIPSTPGEIAIVQLSGKIEAFPASTTDATELIVQDPADLNDDEWYDNFEPQSVTATPVPAGATLTVQYWDGTEWVDVPGMVAIAGPTIVNEEFPEDVQENAQGIRFVYDDPDGFPPGTSVSPNLAFSLKPSAAGSDATITNCATSRAHSAAVDAPIPDPACDDIVLVPPDPGNTDPIDKKWDKPLVNSRSQEEVGATLSWSTAGYTGLTSGTITDIADPAGTALDQSVFDSWDLVRIDPITPAMDPYLTYDQVAKVELYMLPAGSTDPASGVWVEPSNDPCPANCDGTFPGYDLSADQQTRAIGFRLTLVESPTRADRLDAGAPPVGTGIAPSTGNDRHVHPVFRLRDDLRGDPDVPVTEDQVYNVPGDPGTIRNTVAVHGYFKDHETLNHTDFDDINLDDVPVSVAAGKTWTGGPIGIPEAGVPQDQYPTSRVTLTGQNTTPAKIDQLTITDPGATTDPFDTFNLVGFTQITDPASIGATDVTVTLDRGGSTTDYTRAEALALTEANLTDVTGMTVTYSGRIDINATATVGFDVRLRTASRSTGDAPQPGTVDNHVHVEGADLVNYPNVTPNTGDDDADASMTLVAQGLDVTAGKAFDPTSQTEPDNGPVTVTLSGQPSGPSRTVKMVLEDTTPTFWNQYDLVSLNNVSFTSPINRVQVDAYVGGTWSVGGDGNPVVTGGHWETGDATAGPALTLPTGVTADQVQGLRFTFTKADGSNWENPATPKQPISFQVKRRATLNTGGPVLPDVSTYAPAPGETAPGVATNTTHATVTSSDKDANGNPLTASDDADQTIVYKHATNAVQVTKTPNGSDVPPGQPFTYTLTVKNTGGVPIDNPVITDTLPADADGALLTFADNSTTSTRYTYTLDPASSANGAMPIDADHVTVVESDDTAPTLITWTFPAGTQLQVGETYTIQFKMQTRPGLAANTQFTNTLGVSGDRPWDTCSGTLDPDTGECTTKATNTVLSAGALTVHKLVKAEGSDILGVTQDPKAANVDNCEDVKEDGFYPRPCIPIAEPGGDITWRLQFVNTGNRPMDQINAVDLLPTPGDTLATEPSLDRGSDWRPLLAGPRPTVAQGDGTLEVWYTTGGVDCSSGVDGTDPCSGVTWTEWPAGPLPVAADTVTGLRFVYTPKTTVAPGDIVNVDVDMTAPAYTDAPKPVLTKTAETLPAIAYNSVATSGEWVQGDTTGWTLTTEPPRVGVGLATGAIKVEKVVTGEAASQYAPDEFHMSLSCTSVGEDVPLPSDVANFTLVAGTARMVDNLPWHAECTLSEKPGVNGETSSNSPQTAIAEQGTPGEAQTATITNEYDYASLVVKKTVHESAVDQDGNPIPYGPFEVKVECTFLGDPVYADGYGPKRPMDVTLSDDETATFTGLPAGAECTVTETDDKGAASTSIVVVSGDDDPATTDGTESDVTLAPDGNDGTPENSATITNTFTSGPLAVVKKVDGDVAAMYGSGPFTVHVTCRLNDDTGRRVVWDGSLTLGGGAPLSAVVTHIATGALCTLRETDDGGATSTTIRPRVVRIGAGSADPATITVTNTFASASVIVDKEVTGDAADYAADSYLVDVTCSADGNVLPGFPITVTVVPGTPTTVPTLAGSTCTAIETETGMATAVTYDPPAAGDGSGSGEVTPTTDDPGHITVTNEYRAGGLQIVKLIDGPGAEIANGPFTFAVTCSFDGRDDIYTNTVTLRRHGSATTLQSDPITGLPVGAICVVKETATGGADSVPPPVAVTIPDVDDSGLAQVVVAGFTNEFSAAKVQVTKVVTGAGADGARDTIFTIAVTCQLETDAGRVTLYSGSVAVKGGETVTVTRSGGSTLLVPAGTHCFGAETADGGAASSSIDHGSYDDAAVATTSSDPQTLTITATNTFGAEVGPSEGGGGLPDTGGPVALAALAGLILIGTGVVLVAARRTRRHPSS